MNTMTPNARRDMNMQTARTRSGTRWLPHGGLLVILATAAGCSGTDLTETDAELATHADLESSGGDEAFVDNQRDTDTFEATESDISASDEGGTLPGTESDIEAEGAIDVADTESGTVEKALSMSPIVCGGGQPFPTHSFWGVTTADFNNMGNNGTTIHLVYQAGLSAVTPLDVRTFASVQGRWAGFGLGVTYVGWTDAQGIRRSCLHPGAPILGAQTY